MSLGVVFRYVRTDVFYYIFNVQWCRYNVRYANYRNNLKMSLDNEVSGMVFIKVFPPYPVGFFTAIVATLILNMLENSSSLSVKFYNQDEARRYSKEMSDAHVVCQSQVKFNEITLS